MKSLSLSFFIFIFSFSISAQEFTEKSGLLSIEELESAPDYYLLNKEDVTNTNDKGEIRLFQYLNQAGSVSQNEVWVHPNKVAKLYVTFQQKNAFDFPKEVYSFPNVQTLVLAMWNFDNIPFSLANSLPKLQYLDLQGTPVQKLPDNFRELLYLEYLNISRTRISETEKSNLKKKLPKVTFF